MKTYFQRYNGIETMVGISNSMQWNKAQIYQFHVISYGFSLFFSSLLYNPTFRIQWDKEPSDNSSALKIRNHKDNYAIDSSLARCLVCKYFRRIGRHTQNTSDIHAAERRKVGILMKLKWTDWNSLQNRKLNSLFPVILFTAPLARKSFPIQPLTTNTNTHSTGTLSLVGKISDTERPTTYNM